MRFLAISLVGGATASTIVPGMKRGFTFIFPQDHSQQSTPQGQLVSSGTTQPSSSSTIEAAHESSVGLLGSSHAETTTEWTTLITASAQQDTEEIITTESPIVGEAEYAALPDAEDLEGTAYRARSNSVRFSDDESFDDDAEDDIEANRQTEDNGMEFDPDWDLQDLGARLASANVDDKGDGNEVFDDEAYVLHGIVHQYASEYGIESDPLEGDSSSTTAGDDDVQSTADPSETVVLGWVL